MSADAVWISSLPISITIPPLLPDVLCIVLCVRWRDS